MIKIYEQSFVGSDERFSSNDPKKVAQWFLDRGLTEHPAMMDAGYWVHLSEQPHRIIQFANLDKWIQDNKYVAKD